MDKEMEGRHLWGKRCSSFLVYWSYDVNDCRPVAVTRSVVKGGLAAHSHALSIRVTDSRQGSHD